MDLFYPRPLQKPETDDVWFQQTLTVNSESIVIDDKRRMMGSIEERIQKFKSSQWQEEIVTQRRYYSKESILQILVDAGYQEIECTDGYNLSTFHTLTINEPTLSSYVVKAKI